MVTGAFPAPDSRYIKFMLSGRVREFLLPGEAEDDQGFRGHLARFSALGLRILGILEVVVPALWLATALVTRSDTGRDRVLQTAVIASVGAATLLASVWEWTHRWARCAAMSSVWIVAMALVASPARDYLAGQIALLVLIAVAAVPLRPMHTLLLGLAITVPPVVLGGVDPLMPLFFLLVAIAATALTAVVYSQRSAAYRSQSSAQLYERSASLGKLAAAVSHELSSPIGVLTSSIDTLLVLAARQATTGAGEQPKLVALQAELRLTVNQSLKRLQRLVARMQGLTNLEDTGVESTNLNELVREVAAQFEPDLQGAIALDLDLAPLPALTCRPRQLMAVLSSLLSNAVKAVDGRGRIVVSTRNQGPEIHLQVKDSGRGVPAGELETIFDPGFIEKSGRISTRNWSLFSARQIVLEHGGEIRIDSQEGQGTSVLITLPVASNLK